MLHTISLLDPRQRPLSGTTPQQYTCLRCPIEDHGEIHCRLIGWHGAMIRAGLHHLGLGESILTYLFVCKAYSASLQEAYSTSFKRLIYMPGIHHNSNSNNNTIIIIIIIRQHTTFAISNSLYE